MRKYHSFPLLFFFFAASIGLFLRWQFVDPTPGIRFTWFVHSHSHVMFLGWVMNVLFLSFISYHFNENEQAPFKKFFWIFQVFVLAMMISFPIQGYGMYSIIFTTLHTLAVMVFIVVFIRRTQRPQTTSLWFARIAWIFFFISTAGPFALGYLMANGLGQTVWTQYSIYYYLHFQYNGFFVFGVLSLFYQLLERKRVSFKEGRARRIGTVLAAACIPAYALSILFDRPGLLFNVAGGGAAILQLWALWLFVREIKFIRSELRSKFKGIVYNIFCVALIALIAKSLLQLLSAHPDIAVFAYSLKPVVIAYLHLVLVGVITLFLLAWYIQMGMVTQSLSTLSVGALFIGFCGSELCLVLLPWWDAIVGQRISAVMLIFIFSIFMLLGTLLFYLAFLMKMRVQANAQKHPVHAQPTART